MAARWHATLDQQEVTPVDRDKLAGAFNYRESEAAPELVGLTDVADIVDVSRQNMR